MSEHAIAQLQQRVLDANLSLPRFGLVKFTWGNVSEIDRNWGLVAIKPSGVAYERLTSADIVVLDLNHRVVKGTLRPSSDTPTHLELYQIFPQLGGIVHTHSPWATAWAQAGRAIPCLGTTHCDYFYGEIPCTRELSAAEVADAYEQHTGKVIGETFQQLCLSAHDLPGVLVKQHGPFAWGSNAENAVYHAVVLEELAQLAYHTLALNPKAEQVPAYLREKHHQRKHGPLAYYGQTCA